MVPGPQTACCSSTTLRFWDDKGNELLSTRNAVILRQLVKAKTRLRVLVQRHLATNELSKTGQNTAATTPCTVSTVFYPMFTNECTCNSLSMSDRQQKANVLQRCYCYYHWITNWKQIYNRNNCPTRMLLLPLDHKLETDLQQKQMSYKDVAATTRSRTRNAVLLVHRMFYLLCTIETRENPRLRASTVTTK